MVKKTDEYRLPLLRRNEGTRTIALRKAWCSRHTRPSPFCCVLVVFARRFVVARYAKCLLCYSPRCMPWLRKTNYWCTRVCHTRDPENTVLPVNAQPPSCHLQHPPPCWVTTPIPGGTLSPRACWTTLLPPGVQYRNGSVWTKAARQTPSESPPSLLRPPCIVNRLVLHY